MKKSKTSNNPDLADNDREAIQKAAEALNAFADDQDFTEEVSVATEEMAEWAAEPGEPEEEVDLEASDAVEGSELADYEAADIEDVQFLTDEQILSVIESVLFSTDKPVTLSFFRQIFRGTNVKSKDLRAQLDAYASELAQAKRGVTLEEVSSGYQLRTKLDNTGFLKGSVKARPF